MSELPADPGPRPTEVVAVDLADVGSAGGADVPPTVGADVVAPIGDGTPSLRALLGPILVVLCLATILRGFDLGSNPPGYFEDELSGAVSAWSIVTTGHDIEDTRLPFLVTRLEIKQPLYFYATVPFQAVLGHGPLASRMPALLAGILSTVLVLWLAVRLTGNSYVGLVAAGLFAVSPWAVHYGRVGWEPAAVLPFTLGGMGLLWLGLEHHRPWRIVAAAVVLAIGAYTYHPALLVHVLLAGLMVGIQARRLRRGDLLALAGGALLALGILVPYGLAAQDPLFLERTRNISVFKDGLTVEALRDAWRNYWSAWNPAFLLAGAGPTPRINPGPLIMVTTVPLMLAGIDLAIHRRTRADLLLLAWPVLGVLPAALTADSTVPSAARALFVLPPLMILCGMGAVRIAEHVSRRLPTDRRDLGLRLLAVVGLWIVVLDVVAWSRPYFTTYPRASAYSWHEGAVDGLEMARAKVPDGATLCITDIPPFTYPHHMALVLPNPSFTVVRGIRADVCRVPGTYLLARVGTEIGVPVMEVARRRGVGHPRDDFHVVRVTGG